MPPVIVPSFSVNHYLQLRQGRLSGVTREQVAGAFAAVAGDPHGKNKLVLYFHGGLDDHRGNFA